MEVNDLIKSNPMLTSFNIEKSKSTSSINYHAEFEYIDNIGFVYFLCNNNDIVYIGSSTNRQRIGQHQKNKNFNEVFYFICKDSSHIDLESMLISKIPTVYNNCWIAKNLKKSISKKLLYRAIVYDEIFSDELFNLIQHEDIMCIFKHAIECGKGENFKEKSKLNFIKNYGIRKQNTSQNNSAVTKRELALCKTY
jgi:hypothetical protein